jgi:signal transduction histidine kinase
MSDLVIPPGRGLASSRAPAKKRKPVRFGLATRVLLLNTVFVIAAAMLVYVPAITTKRDSWLRNRLSAAYTAALVLDAAPHAMIPPELEQQLLRSVGARLIVLNKHGTKQILAAAELPESVNEVYDFRTPQFLPLPPAIATLMAPPGRVITILGDAPGGGESIAVTMDEAPLVKEIRAFSLRLLAVTFFMSGTVAILATLAIHFMVLRPVRRLTDNLMEFAANPESAARRGAPPPAGSHEIAHAEAELAIMQDSLARELNEKKHLAALGLAVAKINHDMRNMLTSAQLLSDRLANLNDPLAQRLAPKLVATLDRAIRFCQATLAYGQAVDDPPNLAPFLLHGLAAEVIEMVRPSDHGEIEFVNVIAEDFQIVADREQIFRVLMNLVRNSAEALESMAAEHGRLKQIGVTARRAVNSVIIEVEDTGPGLPHGARDKLFLPFSSGRSGGSGLGLVIASDLVRGHGGSIELVTAGNCNGRTIFRITLPQTAAPL